MGGKKDSMSNIVKAELTYTVLPEFKDAGTKVTVPFEYRALTDDEKDALTEVGNEIGLPKLAAMTQQTMRENAGNNAREAAKLLNGHSNRKVMSEQDKADAARDRAVRKQALSDPDVIALLRSKGIKI